MSEFNRINLNEDTITKSELPSNYKNILSASQYYKNEGVMDSGKEGRKASNIYFLRTFNNFIKATMIQATVRKLELREFSVFDLCCGKGGDLDKFFQNNAKLFVGADMSREFLYYAKERIIKIKNERYKDHKNNYYNNSSNFNAPNTYIKGCKCYLYEENVSDPHNHLLDKIPKYIEFDIVSCQMALHYHFSSETNLRSFLKNAVEKLSIGGMLICSTIDDNVMIKRLRDPNRLKNKDINSRNNNLCFGNDFYSVKFESNHFDIGNPYSIKYGFYLEDSIDARGLDGQINYVEEYLIMFDHFVKICEEYDLYLDEKSNFIDYYNKMRKNFYYDKLFKRFVKGMNIENYDKQWEIIQLYQVVTFRKGKEFKYIDNNKNDKKHNHKYKTVLNKFKDKIEDPDEIILKTSEFM